MAKLSDFINNEKPNVQQTSTPATKMPLVSLTGPRGKEGEKILSPEELAAMWKPATETKSTVPQTVTKGKLSTFIAENNVKPVPLKTVTPSKFATMAQPNIMSGLTTKPTGTGNPTKTTQARLTTPLLNTAKVTNDGTAKTRQELSSQIKASGLPNLKPTIEQAAKGNITPFIDNQSPVERTMNTASGAAKNWAADTLNAAYMMGENPLNPLTYTLGQYNKLVAPNLVKGLKTTADKLYESGAQDMATAKTNANFAQGVGVDVGSAGLQLAADVGTGLATGGGALVPMALRSFGGGAKEAENAGAGLGQQIAYGTLQAGASVLTEKLSNAGSALTKAFGKGALDDVLQNATTKAINRFIKSEVGKSIAQRIATTGRAAIGEGIEEMAQDVLTPIFQKLTYDPNAKLDAEGMIYDGLIGAALGGLLGGVGGTNTAQTGANNVQVVPNNMQNLGQSLTPNLPKPNANKSNVSVQENVSVNPLAPNLQTATKSQPTTFEEYKQQNIAMLMIGKTTEAKLFQEWKAIEAQQSKSGAIENEPLPKVYTPEELSKIDTSTKEGRLLLGKESDRLNISKQETGTREITRTAANKAWGKVSGLSVGDVLVDLPTALNGDFKSEHNWNVTAVDGDGVQLVNYRTGKAIWIFKDGVKSGDALGFVNDINDNAMLTQSEAKSEYDAFISEQSPEAVQAPVSDIKPQAATDTAKAVETSAEGQVKPEVQTQGELQEQNINSLREQRAEIEAWLDTPFALDSPAETRKYENQLTKVNAEIDKAVEGERRAAVKTPLKTIIDNLDKYRRSDLESLAEQLSNGNGDGYEDFSRAELEESLRDLLNERAGDFTTLELQAPKYGLFVRPIEAPQAPSLFPENSLGAKITTPKAVETNVAEQVKPETQLKSEMQPATENDVDPSHIGEKFLGYQGEELEIMEIRNMKNLGEVYIVKSPNHNWEHGGAEIWTAEDYKRTRDSQAKIQEVVEANRKYEEERIAKEEAEQKKKAEKEDLFGFDDGKTPMQKGKLLATLMKTTSRNGKSLTRKDDIINRIADGLLPSIKSYSNYTKNGNGETKEHYIFDNGDKTFSEITKVEYDFAQYLLAKKGNQPTTEKSSSVANSLFPSNSLGAKITNGMPQGVGAASKGSQGGMGATKPTRFEVNDEMDSDLDNLPEMSNRVVMTPQKKSGTLKTKLNNFYTRTVDKLNPIVKFSKATGDKTAMLASNSVNAGGTVSHIIENALVDMNGNKIGKSLKEIAADIPKDSQTDFWNYMMQRRNINKAVEDKNVIANYNSRMSTQYVKNVEAQHPEWKKTGDSIVKWITDFQQAWGVNSGLIDQEVFNQLNLKDQSYVPAQREFSEIESALTGGEVGRKFIDQHSPIKKMEGSERDINNPLENIMKLVNTTVKTARYNQVGQSLLKTLRRNPQASQYGEIISKEEATASRANNIVTVIENGQKQYIRINDIDLLQSLNGLPKSTYTIDVLAKPTAAFKKITTQDNPLFGITNLARDLPTGYIYGSQWNPIAYLMNEGKAFGQIATGGKNYQRYKAVGGGMSSFFSSADSETAALNLNKTKNVFQKVGIGFNKFNSMIEEATRLNEFSYVLGKTGDVQKALNAANDVTVNFARGGDIIKTVDRNGVPYLNASIQGLDKLGKAFKPDRIAKTLVTGAVGITLPTLILYLINRDNPYYDELSNRTKDAYFVIPNRFGELDDSGKPMTFIKLPKSRELGMIFGALAERIARAVDGEEEAFKGFGGTLATNISPANPLDSGLVGPMIGLRSNKDFAGRTIVPQSMEARSAHLQFDEKTSEITKFIAEYASKVGIELSPKQMDYLIDSWTGVVGDFLLPATTKGANALSPITNKFTADPRYSSQTIANFYEKMDEAAKTANDKNFAEGLDSETVTLEEKISSNYVKASKEISALSKASVRAGVETLTDEDVKLLKGYGIDTSQKPQDIQKDIRTEQNKIASAAISRGTKADEMELDLNNNSDILKKVEKYQSAGITQKQAYSVYKAFESLKPIEGETEVSTYQKIQAISGFGYTDKQAIALAGTLYTSSEKTSMLPYLTTSKHLLSLYLTNKDSEMISMTIPSTVTKSGVEYELTDKEKEVFKTTYANYFNSRATNITTATDIKSLRDKAFDAAKTAVINGR